MWPPVYGIISEDKAKNVYSFGSHQYALYYWAKAIAGKSLNKNALLIHIDLHSDFISPKVDIHDQIPPELIQNLIKNRSIAYDEFIVASIKMGIVDNVAFCCNPKQVGEFGEFINYESPLSIIELFSRYKNKEALLNSEYYLCKEVEKKNFILDIDLDFFMDFKSNENEELELKHENTIINEIRAINTLYEFANITTISTSPAPDFSWDDTTRRYVQNIFSNYFKGEVNLSIELDIL